MAERLGLSFHTWIRIVTCLTGQTPVHYLLRIFSLRLTAYKELRGIIQLKYLPG